MSGNKCDESCEFWDVCPHMPPEAECQREKFQKEKEKASAWLIGQEYSRRHLDITALRKTQKERELEEVQEMIDEAIDEITESGEKESDESESTEEEKE